MTPVGWGWRVGSRLHRGGKGNPRVGAQREAGRHPRLGQPCWQRAAPLYQALQHFEAGRRQPARQGVSSQQHSTAHNIRRQRLAHAAGKKLQAGGCEGGGAGRQGVGQSGTMGDRPRRAPAGLHSPAQGCGVHDNQGGATQRSLTSRHKVVHTAQSRQGRARAHRLAWWCSASASGMMKQALPPKPVLTPYTTSCWVGGRGGQHRPCTGMPSGYRSCQQQMRIRNGQLDAEARSPPPPAYAPTQPAPRP